MGMNTLDQAKIGVGMLDRGRNCHLVFLKGIICSFKENNDKCKSELAGIQKVKQGEMF